MNTYKLNFKNNLGNIDFVLIDAKNETEAITISKNENLNFICIIDVTGMFVDTNGQIKPAKKF
jgi:hypothetical protein